MNISDHILMEQKRFSAQMHEGGVRIFYTGDGGEKRAVLTLPAGFVLARQCRLKTKPVQAMPNLKRRVIKESASLPGCLHTEVSNGVDIEGTLDSGGVWKLALREKPEGLWFCLSCAGCDEIGFKFKSAASEGFMGFGEQFSHLDMAGKAFHLCVSEQGIGRGAQPLSALVNLVSKGAAGDAYTTYAPMPVFITTENRAMCFEQDSIYWCDIRKSDASKAVFTVWGDSLSGWLFCADSPLELIESHTAVTGRLRPLPEFAYGVILGIRGGRAFADEVMAKCRAHDTPVTALWVEDWQGRRGKNGGPPLWWRWYPDETVYPDFKNWTASLREQGIAVMGYANTFLSADESNYHYTEGRDKGYFVKNPDGTDLIMQFFTGKEYTYVIVDLTNPEAYSWLKEKMRVGMIENGLSGWMADYGEYIPLNAKTHNGNTVEAHCALPVLWAKLNAELIDETGNRGKILPFHRSGGAGSNRYAAVYWAGDQNPTFDEHDGLASSITALITGGISGMSVSHTDIGGFTTLITPVYKLVRKKEVLLRWLEYAAFTPVYRTHDGGWANPLNYQFYFDEEGYGAFAKFGRVHTAIKWYILELEKQAVEKGWPMVRALCLHYPEDTACRGIKRQYLLGEDLLISPVCELGAERVRAYIPNGEWLCPHTEKTYTGGKYEKLPAPLEKPAVLIRAESPRAQKLLESIKGAFGS